MSKLAAASPNKLEPAPTRENSQRALGACAKMHSLDWNDLRYFLAVYREGTLAAAARKLRVRHSTVGRRLDALEQTLGASLFTRTPDGFVPTEAGIGILDLAEQAEQAVDSIERRIAGTDQRIEGTVRIATSEAFSGFLVRHLAVLHARHPSLIVEVLSGNQVLDLSRDAADLALRMTATPQPDLICKRVGDAGWSLYGAEGYLAQRGTPKSIADLADHDIIAFDETLSQAPGAIWLRDHAADARVMFRGNSIMAALNGAIIGLGLAVLPCFLAEAEPTLERIFPEVLGSRELWLVFHPDAARVARVRLVIDFAAEIIAAEAARLRGEVSG